MLKIIYQNARKIYVGNKPVKLLYRGATKIWDIVRSCYGGESWRPRKPWLGNDVWRGISSCFGSGIWKAINIWRNTDKWKN